MILTFGRVTDYQGNVVNEELTEEEVLAKGYNIDCVDCKFCVRCTNCINCTNLTRCGFCENSNMLLNCNNCKSCTDLTNCYDCENVYSSTACSHCKWCTNSSSLVMCEHCEAVSDIGHFKSQPVRIQGTFWPISFNNTDMQIGCQKHTIEEWKNFDDITIKKMNGRAAAFWSLWK